MMRADSNRVNYPDDGCEHSPSCLTCPLPQCKYDAPVQSRKARQAANRDEKLRRSFAQGVKATDLALLYGVGVKTVYRAVNGRR